MAFGIGEVRTLGDSLTTDPFRSSALLEGIGAPLPSTDICGLPSTKLKTKVSPGYIRWGFLI